MCSTANSCSRLSLFDTLQHPLPQLVGAVESVRWLQARLLPWYLCLMMHWLLSGLPVSSSGVALPPCPPNCLGKGGLRAGTVLVLRLRCASVTPHLHSVCACV